MGSQLYPPSGGGGSAYWKDAVANFASLPGTGINGEIRQTIDTGDLYRWNGSSWVLYYDPDVLADVSALETAVDALIVDVGDLETDVAALQSAVTTLDGEMNTAQSDITALQSGKVNKNGDTMTGLLVLSADPVTALGAATKQYVDATAQGLNIKASARAATTANITLSGNQTIDGVSITAGMRVLVKSQTAPAENGIYVSAAGAWTRATDLDTWAEVPGAFVFVEQGTVNGDTGWTCTADAGGTIGVTAMPWTQFSGAGTYTADGQGIELVGTQFRLELDGTSLTKSASGLKVSDQSVRNISTNVTLIAKSIHLVDTSAARSLQLPAPVAGDVLWVKDKTGGAGVNNITITRSAGGVKIETVAADWVISESLSSTTFVSDGTDWFII